MKIYVVTEAKPFGVERYMFVKKTKKEAEKTLRNISKFMRETDSTRTGVSAYISDASCKLFYFIHEEEI